MPLKLSNTLILPNDAVTQTFAFIARKGGGKTYAAGKLTEGLLAIGATVIVIDVVGTWYGLRLSANGKGAGFPIAIFGGEHGDVDLDPTQGEALGQLLVSRDLSAVVDISQFRKGARQRFATDFAEALFHHAKSNRAPRMVIMEEAQTLAPQRTKPGDERMLGAFEDIVRLGRNYGIGATLISQRPQSINKEVLNQVECLFVGQLNADHERKAIEAWVTDHKANKDWTQRLPQLERGHMIAWSPQSAMAQGHEGSHDREEVDLRRVRDTGTRRAYASREEPRADRRAFTSCGSRRSADARDRENCETCHGLERRPRRGGRARRSPSRTRNPPSRVR